MINKIKSNRAGFWSTKKDEKEVFSRILKSINHIFEHVVHTLVSWFVVDILDMSYSKLQYDEYPNLYGTDIYKRLPFVKSIIKEISATEKQLFYTWLLRFLYIYRIFRFLFYFYIFAHAEKHKKNEKKRLCKDVDKGVSRVVLTPPVFTHQTTYFDSKSQKFNYTIHL